jgi:hypothetical protein
MDEHELKYLEKMSLKLGISNEEFVKILEYPEKYPLESPLDYNDRIEQLFNFTKMIFSDDEVKMDEAKLVRQMAISLGFPVKNAEKVTDEAIHLILNNNDLDSFSKAIKEVNKF